ncbi:hypothetical protein E4U53_005559 [Claviceps sorghi]|nr:hypothetical protein E4U53_005559 [Claviceps sorghi]
MTKDQSKAFTSIPGQRQHNHRQTSSQHDSYAPSQDTGYLSFEVRMVFITVLAFSATVAGTLYAAAHQALTAEFERIHAGNAFVVHVEFRSNIWSKLPEPLCNKCGGKAVFLIRAPSPRN